MAGQDLLDQGRAGARHAEVGPPSDAEPRPDPGIRAPPSAPWPRPASGAHRPWESARRRPTAVDRTTSRAAGVPRGDGASTRRPVRRRGPSCGPSNGRVDGGQPHPRVRRGCAGVGRAGCDVPASAGRRRRDEGPRHRCARRSRPASARREHSRSSAPSPTHRPDRAPTAGVAPRTRRRATPRNRVSTGVRHRRTGCDPAPCGASPARPRRSRHARPPTTRAAPRCRRTPARVAGHRPPAAL